MHQSGNETLRVPGANIAYTVRGSGPILLMIAGGEGGGDGYNNLAGHLASQYTVVTYDRRGAANTTLTDPAQVVRLEMHSDDAHRLLAALTSEPACVFGSSAGALIGLDLAIRHPEQVRLLVAHEPPVEGLFPEFDQYQDEVAETYRQQGPVAAMAKFMAQLGVRFDDLEPGVVLPPRSPRDPAQRGTALLTYTFPAVHHYRLDLAALANTPARIVFGGGSAGRETLCYRCAAMMAARLGTSLVEFPSHHSGYVTHPTAFAEKLQEVLKAGD